MSRIDRSPNLEWIEPNWPPLNNIKAATTCRDGGVSPPPWDSLNLAAHVGDNPEHVRCNRRRLIESLALPSTPVWISQVHGVTAVDLDNRPDDSDVITADASISSQPGVVCAVLTADCLPILLRSQSGSHIAAIHAGWRGLAGNAGKSVIDTTLEVLPTPVDQFDAWIGPAIGSNRDRVDTPLYETFATLDSQYQDCFTPVNQNEWLMNLAAIATLQLANRGVTNIFHSGICCYSDNRFFSHRRQPGCGRMATLIWRC